MAGVVMAAKKRMLVTRPRFPTNRGNLGEARRRLGARRSLMSDAEPPEPLSPQDKAEARRRLLSGRERLGDLAKEYGLGGLGVARFLREIGTTPKRRNCLTVAQSLELYDHFNSAFPMSRVHYGLLFGVSFEGVLQAIEIGRRKRGSTKAKIPGRREDSG
jgi:hypothetical protein